MRRRVLDIAISFGILVLGLVEVLSKSGYQLRGRGVASVFLTAGVVLFRRRAPAPGHGGAARAHRGRVGDRPAPGCVVLVLRDAGPATYALGAHADVRVGLAGLALVLAFFTVGAIVDDQTVGDVIFIGILFTGTWVIGRLLERRTNEAARLERHTRVLEQEREQRAREAIAEERARIARELHDIVAHGVSTMVLQVGGVRRRLTPDQQAELEALMNVEETGRRSARRDAPDARDDAPGRQRQPARAAARPRNARRPRRVHRAPPACRSS